MKKLKGNQMFQWKSLHALLGILAFLAPINSPAKTTKIGFRVLSFDRELIGETILSPPLGQLDVKKLSIKGFSKLKLHADWDQTQELFKFVAGKPWSWCYHIYHQADSMQALGIVWGNVFYSLSHQKTLGGHSQILEDNDLIEWLPCDDFKIDF